MSYRLLCDEHVDRAAETALQHRGFDAVHVIDELGPSSPDTAVARAARSNGRLLLTNDVDLLDRSRFPSVSVLYYPDNGISGGEIAARVAALSSVIPDQSALADVTYLTDANVYR